MALSPVSDAPEAGLRHEPEPDRVAAARGRKPLKRTEQAVKEREKKRLQRANAKATELRETPKAAPEIAPAAPEQPCTPADAAMLVKGLMTAGAFVTGRRALVPTDAEALECGKALAPVIDKWGASVVSKWMLEFHALTVCVNVLAPRVAAAFEPEPAQKLGPPPLHQEGGSNAAAAA